MVHGSGSGFRFIGGRLCLNFVATLGKRGTQDLERLGTPDDLARWAVEAELAPTAPRLRQPDLAAAVALREAVYRLVTVARLGEGTPAAADLDLVNRAAARPRPTAMSWDGDRFTRTRAALTGPDLLAAVAADTIDLL